jgi:hypothetical protein
MNNKQSTQKTRTFTAEQLQKLEEAVKLGMGAGWMHNSGRSTRDCCSWNKIIDV